MAASEINPIARAGYTNASSYDAHRPSYPAEALSALVQNANVANKQHAKIVELAAGTGKLTELLAARPEDYDILAVEPHAHMLDVLSKKGLKGVRPILGSGADMKDVHTGWADAVVIAQAFHWFSNMDSLREIHRVLKPGGVLGLVWNRADHKPGDDGVTAMDWQAKLQAVAGVAPNKAKSSHDGEWKLVFDEQTHNGGSLLFSVPLGETSVPWTKFVTKDALWEQLSTISYVAMLEGEKLEAVKKLAYEMMDKAGMETNEGGEMRIYGQTACYWTTALPSSE